jgi:DNA-binding NarL/FixJ family response regulator
MTRHITVLICDDDPRVCSALGYAIGAQPDMAVVGVAQDGDRAVELAREHRPAVAIVDVRMPGGGSEAARRIREQSPRTGVLAFSAYEENWAIDEMKAAGAGAYLVKGTPLDDILTAIRGLDGGADAEA